MLRGQNAVLEYNFQAWQHSLNMASVKVHQQIYIEITQNHKG